MEKIAATYVIAKHDEEAWTDLAESSPRRAVRLAAGSPHNSVVVTVYVDGSFDSDVPIEEQPTFPEDENG
jgi:hypothetical protein